MKNIVISFAMICFLSSCASVHKGRYAKQVNNKSKGIKKTEKKKSYNSRHSTDAGLVISYEWNNKFNDKYFKYLDFTFENQSSKWKKVEKIGIKFLDKEIDSKIFFLKGAPLASYLRGKELKLKVQAQNAAAWAGAIAATAASAQSRSSDAEYRNYNQGLVTIGLATSVAKSVEAQQKQQSAYPEDHLFGSKERFLIPPALAITKYLVFYTEDPKLFNKLKKVQISYYLKDGASETVELNLKSYHYY